MPYDEPEQTELIDVSAIGDALVDEVSGTKTEGLSAPRLESSGSTADDLMASEVHTPGTRLATIGERFVAFWIDATILFCAYWAGVGCYHHFLHGSWTGPAPWIGLRGALFHGIMAACIFLYYIVTEGILYATPGKLACRMVVRRKDGGLASYTSIIVRNLLRPIDTFFLGFVALLFMESTARCQRLGDLVAGTIVVKKQSPVTSRRSPVNRELLVGSLGRLLSGLFDGILIVLFAGGWSLLFNPNAPVISFWLLLLYPAAILIVIATLQATTGTSPGKWLLGYGVVQENGMAIDFSHAVLRTLFLPIDLSGLGWISIVLSPRWQRIGDAVAGTVVCRRPRHWSGALGLLTALACAGSLAYLGWTNPTSWLRQPDFRWSFLPQIDAFPEWPIATAPPEPLAVKNFRCAAGSPEIKRTPAIYLPGETAYFLFEVHGYQKTDRLVWIQQDLVVRYPDLTFGLRQENIIDYKQVVHGKGAIELINNVNLPLTAMPGRYTVFVTLRDRLAGKQVVLQEQFEVKGDLPPPQPAAETSAIQESLAQTTPTLTETPAPAVKPEDVKTTETSTMGTPTVMAAPSIPAPPTVGGPTTSPFVLPGPIPLALPQAGVTTTLLKPPTITQPPIVPYSTPKAMQPPTATYGTPTSPLDTPAVAVGAPISPYDTPAATQPPVAPYGSLPATGPTVLPAPAPPGMVPEATSATEPPELPRPARKTRRR